MLQSKLNVLKEMIIYLSSLAEDMILITIRGLLEYDTERLDEALLLEDKINNVDIEIDELSITMIALYQPGAKDLRTIISIMKMNSDFERMGDLCVNIIYATKQIISKPRIRQFATLSSMVHDTVEMLQNALNAYINEDARLAKQVCEFDDVIDNYKDTLTRELIEYMTQEKDNIESALQLLSIVQNLERIADHCTNIAEETIYIVNGRVIKHHHDDMGQFTLSIFYVKNNP